MRTIKFRGKKKSGEWLYGDLMHYCGATLILPLDANWYDFVPKKNNPLRLPSSKYEVEPATVGQFTGLHDKSGREIYDGDIIRVKEFDNAIMNDFDDDPNRFELFTLDEICGNLRNEFVKPIEVKEINFSCDEFYLDCFYGDMRRSSPIFVIEVVGNVTDNPELIGEGG